METAEPPGTCARRLSSARRALACVLQTFQGSTPQSSTARALDLYLKFDGRTPIPRQHPYTNIRIPKIVTKSVTPSIFRRAIDSTSRPYLVTLLLSPPLDHPGRHFRLATATAQEPPPLRPGPPRFVYGTGGWGWRSSGGVERGVRRRGAGGGRGWDGGRGEMRGYGGVASCACDKANQGICTFCLYSHTTP